MIKRIIIFMSIFLLLSVNCFGKEQTDFSKIQFTTSENIQSEELQKLEENTNKIIKDEVQSGIYKVKLSNFQNDFAYEIIKIDSSFSLFLFGVDKNSNIKLIGKYSEEGIINTAKVDVFYHNEYFEIMSQRPFSAFYSDLILKWDGSKIMKMMQKYGDPCEEALKKERRLISKGDFKGFEKLENSDEGQIFYSLSYMNYGNMGLFAIKTCHDSALKQYKKSKIREATQIMEAGIHIFFNNNFLSESYGDSGDKEFNWKDEKELTIKKVQEVLKKYKDWQSGYSSNPDKLITQEEFAAILNDYAFFLSELHQNKEAKSYLNKVIQFNPKRAVAYINLADVNWTLGNKQEAKLQYGQYLKLLGKKTKNVPSRVFTRMKAN